MNKNEKKLRKIKGMYNLLNTQIKADAIAHVKNEHNKWRYRTYPDFKFEYDPEFACFELKVFKNQVNFYYSQGLVFGNASGLDYYPLLDVFYGSDHVGFTRLNPKYFNEYIEYLTKFVRKALTDGIESMKFGTQTEKVEVTNYLDFEAKQ